MFVNENGKKFLNLPEQVLQNQTDIETNKTNIASLQSSKQDTATAVNDDNLKEKVEALASVDLTDVSVTSLTNTGNTTNTGTLDQEGAATFGSDVEVDGTITLNSPESVTFKTGSLDFSELTNFIATYYANAYKYRYGGQSFNLFEFSSSDYDFDLRNISDLKNATAGAGMFQGLQIRLEYMSEASLRLPDFATAIRAPFMMSDITVTSTRTDTPKINVYLGVDMALASLLNQVNDTPNTWLKSFNAVEKSDGTMPQASNVYNAFANCTALEEVGAFDMSNCDGTWANAFLSCSSLKSIHMTHFKISFDISASTQFEESDLVEIIGNLDTVSTAQTLTMGSTNLAKLTQDEILVATGKGWSIS